MLIAICQARMGAERYPGKVLKKVHGRSLLELYIQRLQPLLTVQAGLSDKPLISKLIVATTTLEEDEKIVKECSRLGVECYRGHPTSLVDRFYFCATEQGLTEEDYILRLTPDDPFVDWKVLARSIALTLRFPGVDFVCNAWPGRESYPEGLDVEIYSMRCLTHICENASAPGEREHIAPYVWNHKHDFWIKEEKNKRDYSWMRWTVDYASDMAMVSDVYGHFKDTSFLMDEIVHYWFENAGKMRTRLNVPRKQGTYKSLAGV